MGRRTGGSFLLLVKVNSCGMGGKPQSAMSEVSGGEKGRFSPWLGNTSISSSTENCAFQLTRLPNKLAAVYMLPTSSIQTLNELEKSSDKLLALST